MSDTPWRQLPSATVDATAGDQLVSIVGYTDALGGGDLEADPPELSPTGVKPKGEGALYRVTVLRTSGSGALDLRRVEDGAASAKVLDAGVPYAEVRAGSSCSGDRLFVPSGTVCRVTVDIAGSWQTATEATPTPEEPEP